MGKCQRRFNPGPAAKNLPWSRDSHTCLLERNGCRVLEVVQLLSCAKRDTVVTHHFNPDMSSYIPASTIVGCLLFPLAVAAQSSASVPSRFPSRRVLTHPLNGAFILKAVHRMSR